MRQPLIAGNWKMNGSRESVFDLLNGLKEGIKLVKDAEVAVCSPSIFIPEVQGQLHGSKISWGGQDISLYEKGAYTGEISGQMLMDFGCKYVIVGHSERREYHAETDQQVAEKYQTALDAGLKPILCIGETLEEREQNETEAVVERQLLAVIDHCGIAALEVGVIAYEPVWAIGTGKTATPEQAQDVHGFIRGLIARRDFAVAEKVQILYGGSMKPSNAAELISKPDIDGGLIGGASLKASDFLEICKAANS
ncbi:MAG: triose-phosphate isomerase [Gammaproteobacteria bacterium]|nr:triose-phosphate isomerase [Gammaproteobacteria bacterium]MCP4994906.1 triose-phosphate isomerase [Gammaproteobacteria bacterium]